MIKIAVCDDDIFLLKKITSLIEQFCTEFNREIMYTVFQSPLELLAEFEKGMRWEVLFLDVIMPGGNGINVAREIRQYDHNVKIIFLTESSEFAVESYTVDAFFYYVKPIRKEAYTVGAYYYQLKPISKEKFYGLLNEVAFEYEKAQQCSLILRCKSGITRIDLKKLEYCEVIGRTLVFHLGNGKVLESSGSLDELYSKLTQYNNFLRPHRSFLVNMEYIQNISGRTIILDSLVEIPIPHGKCSEVKNKYLEYAFSRKQVFI